MTETIKRLCCQCQHNDKNGVECVDEKGNVCEIGWSEHDPNCFSLWTPTSEFMSKTTMIDRDNNPWIPGLPMESGDYWFYGYRYGKIACGTPSKPELCKVVVSGEDRKTPLRVSEGTIMFESEVEEPYYKKIVIPDPPECFEDVI